MRRLVGLAAVVLIALAPAARADDLVLGKQLYVDNCERCHGVKGGGGLGVKLVGDAAYWPFALFVRAVMTGYNDENKKMRALMPIWGKTGFAKPHGIIPTDADLADIQAYLKTFGPKTAD